MTYTDPKILFEARNPINTAAHSKHLQTTKTSTNYQELVFDVVWVKTRRTQEELGNNQNNQQIVDEGISRFYPQA